MDDELASMQGDKDAMARAIGLRGLLYECPECGRLMWQPPGAEEFAIYHRDDQLPKNEPSS